eukprot:scaffold7375_cov268-Pinguiococcus_pyrenoidosus.AAC.61
MQMLSSQLVLGSADRNGCAAQDTQELRKKYESALDEKAPSGCQTSECDCFVALLKFRVSSMHSEAPSPVWGMPSHKVTAPQACPVTSPKFASPALRPAASITLAAGACKRPPLQCYALFASSSDTVCCKL